MCFFKILDCVLGEEVGTVYNKTRLMELLKVIIDSGIIRGCTQIPISTLSHIWGFVRLYGIVFVIIVIIIIIIMIIKSEGVNAQL